MIERKVLVRLLEVQDLPTLPEVMNKIIEAVEDDHSSAGNLTSILEQDHAISARILKLANSAFYGIRNRVDSIQRSIVVIGFDAVKNLALATSVFDSFSKKKQIALDPIDFWMHSLGAAKTVQLLCKKHCTVESPEGCFTTALIHDIGKYVLAIILGDDYKVVVDEARESGKLLKEVERHHMEEGHVFVGHWLAKKWRFPPMILSVLENIYSIRSYQGAYKKEIALVALSSDVSRMAGFGNAGDCKEPECSPDYLEILGLNNDDINDIIDKLSEVKDDTMQFLNILKRE